MDASLFGNLGGKLAGGLVNNITKGQEEEEYMNRTGWFGSYAGAQEKVNSYMAANKERIPMVIEYIASKSGGQVDRRAVTMYINPSRLQFKNNKVKGKSITRGGIFYHHWGDDNMVISLSGSCGYSGMSGIKKLDEIYRMSGVLLAYGENSSAPVRVDNNTDCLNDICNGNWMGALTSVISGKTSLSQIAKTATQQVAGGVIQAVTGRKNKGLQSSKVAQTVAGYVGGSLEKLGSSVTRGIQGNCDSMFQVVAGQFIGDAVQSYAGGLIGNLFGGTNGKGALDYREENVVTYQQAYKGFSDIIDELEDPWRPRQVWIYFEDHVYIGHFDSFNYSRVAETPNITYDMQFTVIREVIVTSYQPALPGFVPAQVVGG